MEEKHTIIEEKLELLRSQFNLHFLRMLDQYKKNNEENRIIEELVEEIEPIIHQSHTESFSELQQENTTPNEVLVWQRRTANFITEGKNLLHLKIVEYMFNNRLFGEESIINLERKVHDWISNSREKKVVLEGKIRNNSITGYNTRRLNNNSFSFHGKSANGFYNHMRKLKKIFPELSLEIVWQDSNNNLFKTII